jgi:hypothetical protein
MRCMKKHLPNGSLRIIQRWGRFRVSADLVKWSPVMQVAKHWEPRAPRVRELRPHTLSRKASEEGCEVQCPMRLSYHLLMLYLGPKRLLTALALEIAVSDQYVSSHNTRCCF